MTLKDYILEAIYQSKDKSIERKKAKRIIKWYNKKRWKHYSYSFVLDVNNNIKIKDYCWRCNRSKKYYPNRSDHQRIVVRIKNKDVYWHKDFEADTFHDNWNGCRYDKRHFTPLRIGAFTVCKERTTLYTWSDGTVHLEEEPDGVYSYHHSPKPWLEDGVGQNLVFGCELEILANNSRKEIAEIATECGLYCEKDSSIDCERGVEIIGEPNTLEEHQSEKGRWLKFLNKVNGKALGWQAGTNYGLHVSFNKRALSDYHTGKMLVFIHHNEKLCENIAGRSANEWSKFKSKKIIHGKQDYENDKYESLAIRSASRVECRIFRSTLKPSGFLRGVEFCAAAIDFTRSASANNLTEPAFKEWLKKNTRNYKNLARHLGVLKENPKNQLTNAQPAL